MLFLHLSISYCLNPSLNCCEIGVGVCKSLITQVKAIYNIVPVMYELIYIYSYIYDLFIVAIYFIEFTKTLELIIALSLLLLFPISLLLFMETVHFAGH